MSNPPRASAPQEALLLRHCASHCLSSLPACLGVAARSASSCTDDARISDHVGGQPALI
jgi:hypothetical protein